MPDKALSNYRLLLDRFKEQVTTKQVMEYLGIPTGNKLFPCRFHEEKTGSAGYNPKADRYHCFGCGVDKDALDLYASSINADLSMDTLTRACQQFGVQYQDLLLPAKGKKPTNSGAGAKPQADASGGDPEQPDLTEYFRTQREKNEQTDYWSRRGLTEETVKQFGCFYTSAWRHPKAPTAPLTARVIIPTSRHSYVARAITDDVPKQYQKQKVGSAGLFNIKRLYGNKPIAIVEGEIDVMSVEQCGGCAVGLGSTANVGKLIEQVRNYRPKQPLVICLDNDKAGEEATNRLVEALKGLNIPHYVRNISGQSNDPNAALMADPEAFREEVEQLEDVVKVVEREEYLAGSVGSLLAEFEETISQPTRLFPTGFNSLDDALDGGMPAGLIGIGAGTGFGKTTFTGQVCDNFAKQGYDVLFFSLEMSRNELIAKSLSRHTCIEAFKEYGNGRTRTAKYARSILTRGNTDGFDRDSEAIYRRAVRSYAEFADRIFLHVGMGNIGVNQVREAVEKHRRVTGNDPVVVVDYLQILAPADMRATDKQNTDKAVLELKRISRDFNIPVIAISSFNRSSYDEPVSLQAFKESGAIEYTSDLLLGLQYEGVDYEEGDYGRGGEKNRRERISKLVAENIQAGKERRYQSIQCKILKNRHGSKGSVSLKFYPAFNYYYEAEDKKEIRI